MKLAFMAALALCATALGAAPSGPVDLNGSWDFRFEEGKSIEEVARTDFAATDAMCVPGCWDALPKWRFKRGTGLYRRTFTLAEPVANAWLIVDGMGLRGDFRLDGKPLGVWPYPYGRLEIPTGPLAAGEHTLFAALDNRPDWSTMKLARTFYDFYLYGGFYHGVSLAFDNRRLFVRTRDYRTGLVEIEAVDFGKADFDATLVFDGVHEVPATFRGGRARVAVPGFRLWSPEEPNLHTVALKAAGERPLPATRFGIRTIEARAKKLWLNGKELFLKGVNRHEQNVEFGSATSPSLMLRDIQIIKFDEIKNHEDIRSGRTSCAGRTTSRIRFSSTCATRRGCSSGRSPSAGGTDRSTRATAARSTNSRTRRFAPSRSSRRGRWCARASTILPSSSTPS